MKVQKKHLNIALLLLAVAVLWALASYFKPSAPPAPPRQTERPLLDEGQRPRGDSEAIDPALIPPPPDVDMAQAPVWRRDPFLFGNESRDVLRAEPAHVSSADPVVRSILFSSARRVALVDNKIVGIGDTVGAFKVADIERTAVVFALNGERRRVAIYGSAREGLTR